MFDHKNIAVVYLRMFISILSGHLADINKKLSRVGETTLFQAAGVIVTVALNSEDGSYYLHFTTDLGSKSFKIGKVATINKSVLNQIEVWFHREHREAYSESLALIEASIKKVNIKPFILGIGWFKRLGFTKNIMKIKYGSQFLDQLLQTQVTVQRGITNRLAVFVDIYTGNIKGDVLNFIPVHAGIMRSYVASLNKDPVNQWLREVLLEHVDINLK